MSGIGLTSPTAISATAQARLELPPHLFIDGERVEASGGSRPVIDPATGLTLAVAAMANAADVDRAVNAAAAAGVDGSPWRSLTPLQRGRILHRLGDLIYEHAEALTELEVLDGGKVRAAARAVDVENAARTFHYYAGWPTKLVGSTVPVSHPGIDVRTELEPVGVTALITAWNFPLLLCAWKVAPALAAGCTIVLKPSEDTPLSALWLAELAATAGLPAGVLNVIPGTGHDAGQSLVSHPLVKKVSFTGSTAVGIDIAQRAAANLTKLTLELGGKSANIIFADADLEAAVAGSVAAITWHSGQTCSAPSRLYVAREIYDQVVAGVQEAMAGLVIGSGLDDHVDVGPLISQRHLERVSGFVQRAAAAGVDVFTGGIDAESRNPNGFFHPPTVLSRVSETMECVRDEIFGPVLVVLPFDDVDDAIRLANDSQFGLAAGMWTTNHSLAHQVSARLKAGMVYINGWGLTDPAAPFGGLGHSGFGKDLGPDSVESYVTTKAVWTTHS